MAEVVNGTQYVGQEPAKDAHTHTPHPTPHTPHPTIILAPFFILVYVFTFFHKNLKFN